jgi:hypothetical protein
VVIQGDPDPHVPIGGGPTARSDRGGCIIPAEDTLQCYDKHNSIKGETCRGNAS